MLFIKRLLALNHILLRLVVFPSVILYFALVQTGNIQMGKRFAFIGNISYSSYLLHFPLQLVIMNLCDVFRINQLKAADSPVSLIAFYLILTIISLLSFTFFEVPMQKWIRNKWGKYPAVRSL